MLGLLTLSFLNGCDTVAQAVTNGCSNGQADVLEQYYCGSGSAYFNAHAPAIEIESPGFLPVTVHFCIGGARSNWEFGWPK